MKRRFSILSLVCLTAFAMQSCFFSEDDIFDASSEERSQQAITEYKNILTAAPDGWLMEYYPGGEDHDMGGVVLLMRFDGENVTMMSDTSVKGYNEDETVQAGQTYTSQYTVKNDQGPVLSFSTYNPLVHYWTEPKGGAQANGYQGDFEFIITDANENQVTLKGKLHGTEMQMHRIADKQDWSTYVSGCNRIRTLSEEWCTLVGYNGGNMFTSSAFAQENVIQFEEGRDETNTPKIRKVSFTYTPEGINLYEPTTINGVTMERFTWNDNDKAFVCTANSNIRLKYEQPADYVPIEFYTSHDWELTYEMLVKDTTEYISFRRIDDTDTLRTEVTALGGKIPIKAIYNHATGMLEFRTHYIDYMKLYIKDEDNPDELEELNTYVFLIPWNDEEYTMYMGDKAGIVSYTTQMSPRSMKFRDNGRTSGFEANGVILYGFENYDKSGMLGILNSYNDITLTVRE